jgi:type I restriction enzyme S subunit
MINMGELFANDRIGNVPMELVPMNDRELATMLVEPGDLLFARQSLVLAGAGKCSLVVSVDEPTTFESHIIRVRLNCEIADPVFYYYYFKSPICRIRSIVTQGVQAGIRGNDLKKLKIHVPSISVQQRVASILAAYDELIENNQRRIQLLEQATQLLYKEWFIHLRFPGHEHATITNGIPKDWERKPFPEVVDFKEGPGLRNYQYREEGIPFLNIRTFNNDEIDLTKTRCIDETEVASKYQHFLLEKDDHVVSSSGTLGRLVTVRACHLPVMLNTSLIRMRPKASMTKWLLKAYLKYGDFIDQARSMATGAAQLNYGPSHLKLMSVLIPSPLLIELFEEFSGSNYEQIKVLLDTNLQLSKARDLLLSRIMNGKVAV